nr:hypothetical transcript [Hymenolepis microstoma]
MVALKNQLCPDESGAKMKGSSDQFPPPPNGVLASFRLPICEYSPLVKRCKVIGSVESSYYVFRGRLSSANFKKTLLLTSVSPFSEYCFLRLNRMPFTVIGNLRWHKALSRTTQSLKKGLTNRRQNDFNNVDVRNIL